MRLEISFLFLAFTRLVLGDEVLQEFIGNDGDDFVCVTLEKYGNGCSGHVQATNTFTAWTKPGSPCKHTNNMKDNSAKDQYCDAHGSFHQTVYIHDKHCRVSWEQKAISPMKLTYTHEKCTYGYKLKSCTPGPCPAVSNSMEMTGDEIVIESVGRQLRRIV